jgi:hypothetical protein
VKDDAFLSKSFKKLCRHRRHRHGVHSRLNQYGMNETIEIQRLTKSIARLASILVETPYPPELLR